MRRPTGCLASLTPIRRRRQPFTVYCSIERDPHSQKKNSMQYVIRTVRNYSLAAGLAGAVAASAQTTTNFPVATAIPDGSTPGLASFKTVSTPITSITNLKVTLKITGTYNGDLYCYLTHGSGFTVLLNRV